MSRLVLVLLACTALLVSYSESMIIPALPDIQSQYNASAAAVSWVPAIYLLVGAVSVPLFGRLGDVHGKKRMLILVMTAYSAAVVLDGFSWDLTSLLVFRAIQGLGLAMFPLAISLVHDELDAAHVPVAVGLIVSMNGVGSAIGLIVGASITESYGWQANYHLLAPFAILLTAMIFVLARESTVTAQERIDYAGLTTIGACFTLLLVGLTEGGTLGWTSAATVGLLAAGAVLGVAIYFVERRNEQPVIPLRSATAKPLFLVNFVTLCTGAVMFIAFYVAIYFAQEPGIGLGRNVEQAGLILAPAAILMLVFAPLAGRLMHRTGPKPVSLIGGILLIVGLIVILPFHASGYGIAAATIIVLAGVAFELSALSVWVLLLSTPAQVAGNTGINTAFRTLGQAVGVTVSGAFLASFLEPGTKLPSAEAYLLSVIVGIIFAGLAVLVVLGLSNQKGVIAAPGTAG